MYMQYTPIRKIASLELMEKMVAYNVLEKVLVPVETSVHRF